MGHIPKANMTTYEVLALTLSTPTSLSITFFQHEPDTH